MSRPTLAAHRALAALATPIAVTQLAQVALTTVDTVMIGLLGMPALAGGGLAIVLFNQLRTMGVGLVTSLGNQVAATTARAECTTEHPAADGTGGGRVGHVEDVRDHVRAGFALATAAGLVGAVLMVGVGHALTWLGQDAVVAVAAQSMLLALAPGLLPCLWFQVLRQYSVGMRRPLALMWITVVSIAVNVGMNTLLAFVLGWGLAGIGVATTLVHLLSFAMLLVAVRRDHELAPMLSLAAWRAGRGSLRRLTRLGVPIAATYGSEAGFFSVVALVMGGFGAAALAAHTVVNQLVNLVFQVSVGISHGSSIMVSRETATGRSAVAQRWARTALLQGAGVAAVAGTVYLVAPGAVLAAFLDVTGPTDAAAVAVATHLLVVAAVLQFADSAQNIGVGLLRGLDATSAAFRGTLVGYWAVGLPAALLLGLALGFGPVGVWLGLLVGLATTAVLLLRRYASMVRSP